MSGGTVSFEVTTDDGQVGGVSLPTSVRLTLHAETRSAMVGLLEEIHAVLPTAQLDAGAYDTTAWVTVRDESGAALLTVHGPNDLVPTEYRSRTDETQKALDAVLAEVMS